ncbi:putative motility protein [Marinobacterium mangrovicola]|uniref:Putative motility protein YjfB-like n=1 Tax=Marinobacterium mangrovicola TaxID=1476959 RepID=A0A4R1GNH4_9GAMM|nr:putative motility protein [Marinobacterium mangrovicola]TCK08780.1 putative motility protein YjfB-like [Marinobacterium mangrovicola]
MDIAGTATSLSQLDMATQHATKMTKMANDQIDMQGQQVMQLLQSTTTRPVDPSSPLGQNIDIEV